MSAKPQNRWVIAGMGVLLQLCLGTIYAWSYFQQPLVDAFGWSHSQVAWLFSLAILFLSLSAALGGAILPRFGPQRLVMFGGAFFGSGYLLAAIALTIKSLPLMYAGYGVMGGAGLGLCYVTPVATVARWFPDKKGLATGMVVMGFGFGALLMSKALAPLLMLIAGNNLAIVFGALGIIFLAITLPVAGFMRNPPANYAPAGYDRPRSETGLIGGGAQEITGIHALVSLKFALIWLIFFCNIAAGIMLIGFQSPMLQDILRSGNRALTSPQLASYGATLIAVSALFNGTGRFFWGWLSDRLNRAQTFRILLGTQIIAFELLLLSGNAISPLLFSLLVCYVLLCYGGGFGIMPAFVLDLFGQKLMPLVYGALLTAWGCAGIAGPQLMAFIKDRAPQQACFYSFSANIVLLAIGFLTAMVLTSRQKPASE